MSSLLLMAEWFVDVAGWIGHKALDLLLTGGIWQNRLFWEEPNGADGNFPSSWADDLAPHLI